MKITETEKAQWLEALRSGNFKQGHSQLYNKETERYCCLGVLSMVIQGSCNYEAIRDRGDDYRDPYAMKGSSDLWNRNDGQQGYHAHTFAEMADHIEVNIEAIPDPGRPG